MQKFSHIEIQGHRGARGNFPENTLPSFFEAIDSGADAIELDLHIASDGIIVIHHDFTISDRLIIQMSPSEIKKINSQIPTLQELFDFIKTSDHPNARHIKLNLEIKRRKDKPSWSLSSDVFARKVMDLVHINGFDDRTTYSSFDDEVLFAVRKINASARIGYINKGSLVELKQIGLALEADVLSPLHLLLENKGQLQDLHEANFLVIPWTVNNVEKVMKLIDLGVDGVITDYPRQMVTLLKRKREAN